MDARDDVDVDADGTPAADDVVDVRMEEEDVEEADNLLRELRERKVDAVLEEAGGGGGGGGFILDLDLFAGGGEKDWLKKSSEEGMICV